MSEKNLFRFIKNQNTDPLKDAININPYEGKRRIPKTVRLHDLPPSSTDMTFRERIKRKIDKFKEQTRNNLANYI